MVGFSATRCATTMPMVRRRGRRTGREIRRTTTTRMVRRQVHPTGRATRYTTTMRMVRRQVHPTGWATRHTTTGRMAHRLERLPEQAGNAGLNIAPSGGVTMRTVVSVAQERAPPPVWGAAILAAVATSCDPPATVAVARTKTSIHALFVLLNLKIAVEVNSTSARQPKLAG